jgi:hypothetical protein
MYIAADGYEVPIGGEIGFILIETLKMLSKELRHA